MKENYLGNGVQYFVYDLSNGKVLKEKTSFFKKIRIFRKWRPNMKLGTILKYTIRTTKDTKLGKKFIQRHPQLQKLFGNPHYPNKIRRKYDYIQDKVIPLDKHFQHNTIQDSKKILQQYILFLIQSRKQGFSDIIYNFDRNCGIDKHGDIIMIDFGELSFSEKEICKSIKEKTRLKKESYKDISEELKLFFREEMDKYITIENFEKYWKTKNT